MCRLRAALAALAPGGTTEELDASDADELLARIEPVIAAERARHELALGLLDGARRLDAQLEERHRRIRAAVRAAVRPGRSAGARGSGTGWRSRRHACGGNSRAPAVLTPRIQTRGADGDERRG